MRASLAQLHQRLGVTTVYVTHDQTEAMTLGQRVAVMRDGHILQVDRPKQLYEQPNNLFIAAFIGSPAMNLVEAKVDGDAVRFGQFRVPFADGRPPDGVGSASSWASARRASRTPPSHPGLPTITAADRGAGGARLGRARLLPRRCAADHRGGAGERLRKASLQHGAGALHGPGGRTDGGARRRDDRARGRRGGASISSIPQTATRLSPQRRSRARRATPVTKQRETREQRPRADRGARRRRRDPVRAPARSRSRRLAADGARRARRARARGLPRPPARRRHVRRRAEGRQGHGRSARSATTCAQRGLTPASRTLDLADRTGRRPAGPPPPRLAVRARGLGQAPSPRRRRADGDRAAARPRVARPGPDRARPRGALVLRPAGAIATTSRSSAAPRRSSRR